MKVSNFEAPPRNFLASLSDLISEKLNVFPYFVSTTRLGPAFPSL